MQLLPTHGELQALRYAIEQTGVMLKGALNTPSSVCVYSDVDHVQQILHGDNMAAFVHSARQVAAERTRFEQT